MLHLSKAELITNRMVKKNKPFWTVQKPKEPRIFVEIFVRSWWVLLFFIVALYFYEQGLLQTEREEQALLRYREQLLHEENVITAHLTALQEHVKSQGDPEWIEMLLMQRLGVVPEGAKKVYFQQSETTTKTMAFDTDFPHSFHHLMPEAL